MRAGQKAYPYAQRARKQEIIRYTDAEYVRVVQPLMSDWDRVETDALFELCERFGLRFINIADRLPTELEERISTIHQEKVALMAIKKPQHKPIISKISHLDLSRLIGTGVPHPRRERTVDEVKDRYYSVARAILTS